MFITQPAEKAVYLDASGYIAAADGRNVTNVDASTAATLATARNIGGVSFDGSANIDLAGVNTAGNQDTSGNAATATALETGRTISLTGDVTGTSGSFDGSGNASIAATIAANSVALGTDTTGNYVGSGATSGNGISGSVSSEGGTFTVTSNATNLNTGSTTVFRDASGNFSAGTITAALSGNATTATSAAALTTARNIAVSGAVTGNANFDGSGNITISTTATSDPTITLGGDLSGSATLTNLGSATLTATINANSVALGTDTTGSYVQQGATSGNGISGSVNSEAGTFTVTSNATNANTGNTIVYRDASGNFSAGTITGTLSGNATNISQYTINQNVGTGNSPTFAGLTSTGIVFSESVQEDYDALSGTSPAPDADNAGGFSLSTTGNTTFTFVGVTSGRAVGFVLQITAGGTHTITWPSSVDWAGGTAPDAPASGESNLYVFYTRDGGTNWIGVLSAEAYA